MKKSSYMKKPKTKNAKNYEWYCKKYNIEEYSTKPLYKDLLNLRHKFDNL